MSDSNPFLADFDQLPNSLPIFPLSNAIVMPGSQLPLNIFEPRYLNMVFDAMAEGRLIGMVQPDPTGEVDTSVYRTGTAGRIVSFNETQDGRILIVLSGVCRFDISSVEDTERGYRTANVDWSRFSGDYDLLTQVPETERLQLLSLLRVFFDRKGIETNWGAVEQMPVSLLVNVLGGQLPFESPEKQAIVEAVSTEERLDKLINLLQFEVAYEGREITRH